MSSSLSFSRIHDPYILSKYLVTLINPIASTNSTLAWTAWKFKLGLSALKQWLSKPWAHCPSLGWEFGCLSSWSVCMGHSCLSFSVLFSVPPSHEIWPQDHFLNFGPYLIYADLTFWIVFHQCRPESGHRTSAESESVLFFLLGCGRTVPLPALLQFLEQRCLLLLPFVSHRGTSQQFQWDLGQCLEFSVL